MTIIWRVLKNENFIFLRQKALSILFQKNHINIDKKASKTIFCDIANAKYACFDICDEMIVNAL